MMTGEVLALLAALFAVVVLCAWLVWEVSRISRETRKNQTAHVELIEKLSQLVISKDAITYQTLRAVDGLASYDDGSAPADLEETDDGTRADERALVEEGISADPFIAGTVFER